MAALTSLITECRNELIDTGGSPRWTNAEFLEWANAFFRELCTLAPSEVTSQVTLSLVAGAYQSLPSTHHKLVEISTNAAGEFVREVDYLSLKASLTAGTVTADADGPKEFARLTDSEFVVYPAIGGGGASVSAMVVTAPTISTVNDTVPCSAGLFPAMVHYMIYRARSKDAEDTVMLARAQDAYNKFRQLIGGAGESAAA